MKFIRLLLVFGIAISAFSQTAAPTTAACASNVTYNYFAETGITYASVASTTSGFGLRIGCSNVFVVTDIDSTIGAPLSAYSTLRVGGEYVAAVHGLWSLTARAALGATTSSAISFAGGGGIQFDLGNWLTKGKFGLLANAQLSITAVPNAASNVVAKGFGFLLRKTF